MRNLEPETATLIALLVRGGGRRCLLEIGTSNGYSTLWLAWAARATGGRVTSVDADRVSAPAQLEQLVPKLAPDVMIANNVLSHPREVAGYLEALEELPGFDRLVVPVGKGLSIAYRGTAPG